MPVWEREEGEAVLRNSVGHTAASFPQSLREPTQRNAGMLPSGTAVELHSFCPARRPDRGGRRAEVQQIGDAVPKPLRHQSSGQ